MLKFLRNSVPSLLAVALAAGAGLFALRPLPASTSEVPTPKAIPAEVQHAMKCTICQFPGYTPDGELSRFGSAPDLAPLTAL